MRFEDIAEEAREKTREMQRADEREKRTYKKALWGIFALCLAGAGLLAYLNLTDNSRLRDELEQREIQEQRQEYVPEPSWYGPNGEPVYEV